jgi:hypothetical protein
MEDEKRRLIVKEIDHWRRSRLLPEHYCDFLMNLYLEDGKDRPKSLLGVSAESILASSWKTWVLVLVIIGIISFSALNFNSFGIAMQIGILALLVLGGYAYGFKKKNDDAPLATPLLFGIASITLLFIGLYIMKLHGLSSPNQNVGYIAFCSIIWLLGGISAKIKALQFSGWIVLLGTYGWLLVQKLREPIWWPLELSWVPLSILFIWLAWLVHHTSKEVSGSLFFIGFLALFAPEVISFLTDVQASSQAIQLSFMIKLITAGTALYVLRKKWIEWVM